MAFKDLNPHQKIVSVHVDMLKHPEFCILGSVTQVGKVLLDDLLPTAGTDGVDVHYNPEFISTMTRKQLRYLVAHEAAHRALKHCTDYMPIKKKHPNEFAQAVDYVVNGIIESMDIKGDFLERPTTVAPLIDAKYADKSVPEVVRMLLQNPPPQQQKPMDEHMEPAAGEDGEAGPKAMQAAQEAVAEAMRQGEIVQVALRQQAGIGTGNNALSGFREQKTDWRGPLRRFITDLCEGDEQSRFNPPNRRFMPLGIILPSHFSEATGEVVIACDTSGSMSSILPMVFGEVANICKTVTPASVRVLWWDTEVKLEQRFTPKDYDNIAKLVAPRGGGGTSVSCVAKYMREKSIKPKVTVVISDGYVESSYESPAGNLLWGICGNRGFRPPRGKVLHIEET
jgi:predicted metal-dependent peptidase